MDKKIRLSVRTPSKTVTEREVDFLVIRTKEGDMGILPDHGAWSVLLDFGVLRAYIAGNLELELAVMGGCATIQDNEVIILTPIAEHPEHIEEALQHLEEERKQKAKDDRKTELEIQRAEMALRRALHAWKDSQPAAGGLGSFEGD